MRFLYSIFLYYSLPKMPEIDILPAEVTPTATLGPITAEEARQAIRAIGQQRIFFGQNQFFWQNFY